MPSMLHISTSPLLPARLQDPQVAIAQPSVCLLGVWQDLHQYLPSDDFVALFNTFDNWNRSQPLLVGVYALTTFNNGSTSYYINMMGSVSEAVYMIGMERNSDVVKMATYAPLLEHFDRAEWSPDLIGFDVANGVTRSTSYFVQQMFASHKGDTILTVDSDTAFGPVYWVASSSGSNNFVKLANYGADEQSVTVTLSGKTSGTLTALNGEQYESNYSGLDNIIPAVTSVTGSDGAFGLPCRHGVWLYLLPRRKLELVLS